jgi:transposase InsO family protein
MKQDYPDLSVKVLCRLFGKTRHAYYDYQWRQQENIFKDEVILQIVQKIRQSLPRLGTRKLQEMLAPELKAHQIEVGRDYLFDLLEAHKLLIRQRKRKVFTTDSRHWMRKYSNLTSQLIIYQPEQLWVSDMTYIKIQNQWGYLSLITDAYSRKIMGYCLRTDMLALGCIAALKMALGNRVYQDHSLIHHSDRGAQYCSREYVEILGAVAIAISMTEKGDPYENALAERMNGIIKGEFNLYSSQLNFEQTNELVTKRITAYNELRPHGSCDYLTPNQAHQTLTPMKKRWKNYPRLTPQQEPGAAPLTEQAPALVGRGTNNRYLDPESTKLV